MFIKSMPTKLMFNHLLLILSQIECVSPYTSIVDNSSFIFKMSTRNLKFRLKTIMFGSKTNFHILSQVVFLTTFSFHSNKIWPYKIKRVLHFVGHLPSWVLWLQKVPNEKKFWIHEDTMARDPRWHETHKIQHTRKLMNQ